MRLGDSELLAGRSEWQTHLFGEIVRNVTERVDDPMSAGVDRYVGLEHLDSNSLRIRRWGHPGDVSATKLRFRKGDIVFGRRRVYQRKLAVADFDGICSAHALVLRARDEVVLPEFLPFFLQSETFFSRALEISVGSLSPTINWRTLAKQEFAVPPKTVQKRIASLLWRMEDALGSLGRLSSHLQRARDAGLHRLVLATDARLPFSSFIEDIRYGTSRRSDIDSSFGVPVVGIPHVLRDGLKLDHLSRVDLGQNEVSNLALREGDILIVRTNGNPDYVGRSVVVGEIPDPIVFASYLIRVRVDPSVVDPYFTASLLNSNAMKRNLLAQAQSSAGNYNVSIARLKRLAFPATSLHEQRAWRRQALAIDAGVEAASSHQASLAALKVQFLSGFVRGRRV